MDLEVITDFCALNSDILSVYRVGSGSFVGTEDTKDIDLLIVTEKGDIKKKIEGYDCFTWSYADFVNMIHLNTDALGTYLGEKYFKQAALLSVVQGNLIYGRELIPSGYNFFEYKKQILNFVLDFGKINYFNKYLCYMIDGQKYCAKWIYYALWVYYVFQNHSLELTDTQREMIALGHACRLPLRYRDELQIALQEMLLSTE